MTRHEFEVESTEAGQRLDRIVAARTGLSRSAVRSLEILLDGERVPLSTRLQVDQKILVHLEGRADEVPAPAEVEFEVRYEDGDIAVVNKPPGLAVHPGAGQVGNTLVNGILYRWPQVSSVGERGRPGIVHRLDMGTSGLMLVALTQAGYEGLIDAVSGREVERDYLALVIGEIPLPEGRIEAPIGRDPRNRRKMAVVKDGRPAFTNYVVSEHYGKEFTLLEISLETGRTHQIRVHMAAIGHPIAGDELYGGSSGARRLGLERPFLHSAHIAFTHPLGGARVEIHEPLPADLESVLETLRRSSRENP